MDNFPVRYYLDKDGTEYLASYIKQNYAQNTLATTDAQGLMSAADKNKLDNLYSNDYIDSALGDKVTIVEGKGLSTNDYSADDKNKLDGIENGAEKNKVTSVNNKIGDVVITATDLGVDPSLQNKTSDDILSGITNEQIVTGLGYTPIDQDKKGAANGIAELDKDGKVPASQLPSFIGEIIESSVLPETGEEGKIYYNTESETFYIWDGNEFKQLLDKLELGETSSTAFAGDKGKTAYEHALKRGENAYSLGLYKFAVNDHGHVINAVEVNANDIKALGISGDGDSGAIIYSGGQGINVSGSTITNTGVLSVAEGSTNGTVSVNTNGTPVDVPVHGLGSAAYNNADDFAPASISSNLSALDEAVNNKVDKVDNKGLSENDYTTEDKNKLSGIENGAQVNVQSDWNESDTSSDAFIKNKPDLYNKSEIDSELSKKVDAVENKGLSTEDFTTDLKNKLTDLDENAEENQNAFSKILVNGSTITATGKEDLFSIVSGSNISIVSNVENKTITISSSVVDPGEGNTGYDDSVLLARMAAVESKAATNESKISSAENDIQSLQSDKANQSTTYTKSEVDELISGIDVSGKSDNNFTDFYKNKLDNIEANAEKNLVTSVNKKTGDVNLTASDFDIDDSLLNKTSSDILSELTKEQIVSALNYTPLDDAEKGVANGVAQLDENGKVPSSQLPASMNGITEVSALPTTGENNKIYYNTTDKIYYKWTGNAFVPMTDTLVLGETSTTAFAGNKGKVAYNHASAKGSAFASNLYKITTNDEGHVIAAVAVTKADILALGAADEDLMVDVLQSDVEGLF